MYNLDRLSRNARLLEQLQMEKEAGLGRAALGAGKHVTGLLGHAAGSAFKHPTAWMMGGMGAWGVGSAAKKGLRNAGLAGKTMSRKFRGMRSARPTPRSWYRGGLF